MRLFPRVFAQLLAIVMLLTAAAGHTAAAGNGGSATEVVAPAISYRYDSPRSTMATFLEQMNLYLEDNDRQALKAALRALDTSYLDPIIREERAPLLAEQLKTIIDKTRYVDLESIPDDKASTQTYTFELKPEYADSGHVEISQSDDGAWKFTPRTLKSLDALYAAMGAEQVVDELVEALGESARARAPKSVELRVQAWVSAHAPFLINDDPFLLYNWQWIGLMIIIFVGFAVGRLAPWIVAWLIARWMRKIVSGMAIEIDSILKRPLTIAVMALVWWGGLRLLNLPDDALTILLGAAKIVSCVAIVWTFYRLVDVLSHVIRAHAEKTDSQFDDLLAPIISGTLKVFVIAFGLVFLAEMLDWNLTGLLAGLGIGGLAFALAAKDTIENVFGSITVLIDKPFKMGDWIIVDGQEGVVERLGLRSTRIRTFYNSQITIPNSNLIKATIDNMGERQYRRISTKLSLTYDTPPDKIEAFCEGIRELIRSHPYTRKDYYHVWLNEFAGSSLNVLLYCFHEVPDWGTELRERHKLYLDIIRLASELGVEFAFPTQTLHLHRGPDDETPPNIPPPSDPRDGLTKGRQVGREVARGYWQPGSPPPPPVIFQDLNDDEIEQELKKSGSAGDGDG